MSDDRIDVEYERRAVLYHPDGRALVRTAGFRPTQKMALQSTGQFPQLTTKMKGTKKTSGKPKGGRKSC